MLPELSFSYILLFIAFVLPGSIAIYAFRLRVPQHNKELRHFIIEAVSISLIFFITLFYFIKPLFRVDYVEDHSFHAWVIVFICFVLIPFVSALLYAWFLRILAHCNFISVPEHTAFDRFFGTLKSDCFLLVELTDGRLIGGYFGEKSYASTYPNQGHLYIEQLYRVDENGAVTDESIPGMSIILGPEDYKYVIIIENS